MSQSLGCFLLHSSLLRLKTKEQKIRVKSYYRYTQACKLFRQNHASSATDTHTYLLKNNTVIMMTTTKTTTTATVAPAIILTSTLSSSPMYAATRENNTKNVSVTRSRGQERKKNRRRMDRTENLRSGEYTRSQILTFGVTIRSFFRGLGRGSNL